METSPTPTPAPRRRAGVLGALIGSLGLIAVLLAMSATAGANDTTLQSRDAEPATVVEDAPVDAEDDFGDVDVEEFELDELPEEFAAAEACWIEVESSFDLDELDEEIIDEDSIDWDALDAELVKCDELLPEDVRAQIAIDDAAWEAFDECIDEAFGELDETFGVLEVFEGDLDELDGEFEAFEFGPAVSIMDGDTFSVAEFGDGDGVITITKSGDDITVTSDGDVEIIDEDVIFDDVVYADEVALDDETMQAYDDAFAGCEDKLPEGAENAVSFGFGDAELVNEFDLDD